MVQVSGSKGPEARMHKEEEKGNEKGTRDLCRLSGRDEN